MSKQHEVCDGIEESYRDNACEYVAAKHTIKYLIEVLRKDKLVHSSDLFTLVRKYTKLDMAFPNAPMRCVVSLIYNRNIKWVALVVYADVSIGVDDDRRMITWGSSISNSTFEKLRIFKKKTEDRGSVGYNQSAWKNGDVLKIFPPSGNNECVRLFLDNMALMLGIDNHSGDYAVQSNAHGPSTTLDMMDMMMKKAHDNLLEILQEDMDSNEESKSSGYMGMGGALELLEKGHKLQRAGWNGKGMWIELQVPDKHSKMTLPYLYLCYPSTPASDSAPSNHTNARVPWLASQTDILAKDWQVLEE